MFHQFLTDKDYCVSSSQQKAKPNENLQEQVMAGVDSPLALSHGEAISDPLKMVQTDRRSRPQVFTQAKI